MQSPEPARRSPRRALVTAVVLILVVQRLVPFGRELLYPFTLLATWVHEMGHGIAAVLVGGRFQSLEIFANASGLAHTFVRAGWRDAVVAIGGLLAPPLVGAAVLASARGGRRARALLAAFGVALVISLAIWVRSPAGLIAMPLVAAALGFIAWKGSPDRCLLAAQALGILLALDTVTRIDYLFTSSVEIDGARMSSDIARVAESLGGHYLLWGLLVAAFALALCGAGVWAAWRRPRT